MISSISKHQKHALLEKPSGGEWARNEFAILGTTCDHIKELAYAVIQALPQYKMAYVDADHKSAGAESENLSAIRMGAYIEYTNKISHTQLNINTQPTDFQKKTIFNDCDVVLVNGNHFTATKQIVVIDEKKPLEKKLDKLTDVQMILFTRSSEPLPSYLSAHLPHINSIPTFSINDVSSIAKQIQQTINIPVVNGLILTGGNSMRMGRDKASLPYHGVAQKEHLYQLLQPLCNEVFLSVNEQQAGTETLPFIQDRFLGLGPLGGILTAFQHNPNAAWLTVACDLPFLTENTLSHLISHRNPSKIATAFRDAENSFPEPLITIWEPRAYLTLLQFLAQGYSCPRKALINSDVHLLQAPDVSAFKNINTTEEYKEIMFSDGNKHNCC